MSAPVVAFLPLTAVQLDALTKLAGKGRVFMDVDPTFLGHPRKREVARSVLTTLRRLNAEHQDA